MSDPSPPPPLATFVVTQNLETDTGGVLAPVVGGVVTFVAVPRQVLSPALDTYVEIQPVTGTFNSAGQLCSSPGVPLELVDSVDLAVNELIYVATYSGIAPVPPRQFAFAAPGTGAEVDLDQVQRVPVPPPGAVRGG